MTYRQIAERALGKPLPAGAEVHHLNGDPSDNRPGNLVICQDAEYHDLLHRRMRELGIKRPESAPTSYILRDVNDDLWRQVKIKAVTEGVSVKAVIEQLLREWVSRPTKETR